MLLVTAATRVFSFLHFLWVQESRKATLQGTNISPKNIILKMIFLFPRWDMFIPWRVYKPAFSWYWEFLSIPNNTLIPVLGHPTGVCFSPSNSNTPLPNKMKIPPKVPHIFGPLIFFGIAFWNSFLREKNKINYPTLDLRFICLEPPRSSYCMDGNGDFPAISY